MSHVPTDQDQDRDRSAEASRHDAPAQHQQVGKLKTSAAAVFSLVFGLSALFCVLTLLLSPVALVFGIIALILGFVGMKKAKEPNVTGKGVAIGGLVMGGLGLLLSLLVLIGAGAFLQSGGLQQLRDSVPTQLPAP